MGLTEDEIAGLLTQLDNDDSSEEFLVHEAILTMTKMNVNFPISCLKKEK